MICSRCLQTRRRSFFADGVCEQCTGKLCAPSPPDARYWALGNVVGIARRFLLSHEWVPGESAGVLHESFDQYPPLYDDDTAACLAWVKAIGDRLDEQCTDYECALYLLSRKGWVSDAEFKLASSALVAWRKATAPKPTAHKAPETGKHYGAVGDRVTIEGAQCTELKNLGVNPEHPEYGERWLIKFTTPCGCELVWFTSADGKFDPEQGRAYDITAKIKEHGVYQGHKNTIISRTVDARAPKVTRKKKETL